MSSAAARVGGRSLSSAASLRHLRRFELERNPLWWTPGVEHLCASDVEPLALHELLALEPGSHDAFQQLSLGYPDSQGSSELREEIAAMYGGGGRHGGGVSAADVTVVAPQEGILLSMLALCRPGDRVVAAQPAYQSLTEVARSIGCEVTPWQVRCGGGGGGGGGGGECGDGAWRFDVDELRTLLPGAALLVVNFPHNPTGALPTATEWAAVGELCERHGVRIFSDEMYRGLELHGGGGGGSAAAAVGEEEEEEDEEGGARAAVAAARRRRLCSAAELGERHVALSGLSKWAALPGLRAGWLVSRDGAFTAEANRLKDYTTICPPAPTEHLAALALRQRGALLRRSHALVARGLAAARSFAGEHAAWLRWREPQGGSVCFPELRGGGGGGSGGGGVAHGGGVQPPPPSAARWCEAVARDAGLMLLPSTLFGDGAGDACFRIGLGRANCTELLERLDAHVREHGPPT